MIAEAVDAAVQRGAAPEPLPERHTPSSARTAPLWAQPDEEAA